MEATGAGRVGPCRHLPARPQTGGTPGRHPHRPRDGRRGGRIAASPPAPCRSSGSPRPTSSSRSMPCRSWAPASSTCAACAGSPRTASAPPDVRAPSGSGEQRPYRPPYRPRTLRWTFPQSCRVGGELAHPTKTLDSGMMGTYPGWPWSVPRPRREARGARHLARRPGAVVWVQTTATRTVRRIENDTPERDDNGPPSAGIGRQQAKVVFSRDAAAAGIPPPGRAIRRLPQLFQPTLAAGCDGDVQPRAMAARRERQHHPSRHPEHGHPRPARSQPQERPQVDRPEVARGEGPLARQRPEARPDRLRHRPARGGPPRWEGRAESWAEELGARGRAGPLPRRRRRPGLGAPGPLRPRRDGRPPGEARRGPDPLGLRVRPQRPGRSLGQGHRQRPGRRRGGLAPHDPGLRVADRLLDRDGRRDRGQRLVDAGGSPAAPWACSGASATPTAASPVAAVGVLEGDAGGQGRDGPRADGRGAVGVLRHRRPLGRTSCPTSTRRPTPWRPCAPRNSPVSASSREALGSLGGRGPPGGDRPGVGGRHAGRDAAPSLRVGEHLGAAPIAGSGPQESTRRRASVVRNGPNSGLRGARAHDLNDGRARR